MNHCSSCGPLKEPLNIIQRRAEYTLLIIFSVQGEENMLLWAVAESESLRSNQDNDTHCNFNSTAHFFSKSNAHGWMLAHHPAEGRDNTASYCCIWARMLISWSGWPPTTKWSTIPREGVKVTVLKTHNVSNWHQWSYLVFVLAGSVIQVYLRAPPAIKRSAVDKPI